MTILFNYRLIFVVFACLMVLIIAYRLLVAKNLTIIIHAEKFTAEPPHGVLLLADGVCPAKKSDG